jgi:hypothetical protein
MKKIILFSILLFHISLIGTPDAGDYIIASKRFREYVNPYIEELNMKSPPGHYIILDNNRMRRGELFIEKIWYRSKNHEIKKEDVATFEKLIQENIKTSVNCANSIVGVLRSAMPAEKYKQFDSIANDFYSKANCYLENSGEENSFAVSGAGKGTCAYAGPHPVVQDFHNSYIFISSQCRKSLYPYISKFKKESPDEFRLISKYEQFGRNESFIDVLWLTSKSPMTNREHIESSRELIIDNAEDSLKIVTSMARGLRVVVSDEEYRQLSLVIDNFITKTNQLIKNLNEGMYP